jgi:glycine/D-amino acid oxidase-like deaminating enzyme
MNIENNVHSTWTKELIRPPEIPTKADVVIIGGGIVGISTAYYLAKQGIDVCLCEKGHISGEQSGRNWGWVRVQGRDEREIPMMLRSLDIWRNLSNELGEDVGYREDGCLYTAYSEKELGRYQAWIDLANDYDIKTSFVSRKALEDAAGMASKNWVGGIITRTDGRAEPQLASLALSRGAKKNGASVLTNTAVRGLETSSGKVSAVVTEYGRINTSIVLCAAGAWSSLFCGSLDIKVPQLRVRGTVARTNVINSPIKGNIFDKNIGIRKRNDGGYTVAHGSVLDHSITPSTFRYAPKYLRALWKEFNALKISIGMDFFDELKVPKKWKLDEKSPFEYMRVLNPSPNQSVIDDIERSLGSIFPEFKNASIIESWAGMVETTPDVAPIICESDNIPGFFIGTGFSGHGFGIGPAAGQAIAEMIENKNTIDLEPFKLKRFFDGTPIRPNSTI